ncbi:thioredoxin family protein [Candidatus Pyrohabitans sp.]
MEKGVLIELFTSPTCPYCPQAKKVAERIVRRIPQVLIIERDVSRPENAEIAHSYGIQGVPAMVINGRYRITGVPGEEQLLRYLSTL